MSELQLGLTITAEAEVIKAADIRPAEVEADADGEQE